MQVETCAICLTLTLFLGACDSPASPTKTRAALADVAPDIAVSYAGGEIQLSEIEAEIATSRTPACVKAKNALGRGSVEDLIPCYGELAEAIAVERIILADIPDLNQELEGLDDDYSERRNQALLGLYYRRSIEQLEVTEAEIERYFVTHKEDFATPRQFTMFNIFRRHRDPVNPQQTIVFLTELKSRIDAGETFGAIAREYSDSETRLLDGLVGHIAEEELSQRLRNFMASLEDGEVSEPLSVAGGAVLMKLENVTLAIEPDLERHRSVIINRLTEQKNNEAIDKRIAGQDLPQDAILFSDQELLDRLDAEDPDQLIFNLGGQQLTVAEFRQLVGLQPLDRVADLPMDVQEQILERNTQLKRRRLLLIDLLASNHVADRELREQVEQPLRKERLTRLVDEHLQQDMWQSVDRNPAALERFFKDNSHHYQSPLKFKLQIWHLPFDKNPAVQLAAMERMRIELEQGDYPLPSAAERLGGSLDDLGWREFPELDDLPGKARSYLLQAVPGGYSVPYQQDESLHMIWVEAQQPPHTLAYSSIMERVREDYFNRFERRLYQDAKEKKLAAVNFAFYSENVRKLLLSTDPINDPELAIGRP